MPGTKPSRDPAGRQAWKAANDLIYWLQQCAEEDPLFLPGLRRGEFARGRYHRRNIRTVAIKLGPPGDVDEVGGGVARLFACYHRAPHDQQWLTFGTGSMGAALARLSWTKHDDAHDRSQRYLAACLRQRGRLPWRELATACIALRDNEVPAPDWRKLILDLAAWRAPRSWPERTPSVQQRWSDEYHVARREPLRV